MPSETYKGQVIWFSDAKGYGFLALEGLEGQVFVHYSGIVGKGFKTLVADQKVECNVVNTAKGEQAENVVVIE